MGRRITRLWGIAVAVIMPVVLMPVGAGAIIGGEPDGDDHANVGFVLVRDQAGNLADACTGTLIAESVVLTAAHCLPPGFHYVVKLSDTLLFTRNRAGSICKGDSGGPVFSDAGVLVALGNYTSGNCKGTNSGPRLDIEPVQSFLSKYVPLSG